jgi:hypothetical protein
MNEQKEAAAGGRKVGAALGIGILLLPFVFAWFTLRKGFSKVARIVSLGWMIVLFALLGSNAEKNSAETVAENSMEAATTSGPEEYEENVSNVEEERAPPNAAKRFSAGVYEANVPNSYCANGNEQNGVTCLTSISDWEYLCLNVKQLNNPEYGNIAEVWAKGYGSKADAELAANNAYSVGNVSWDKTRPSGKMCAGDGKVSGIYDGTTHEAKFSFYVDRFVVDENGDIYAVDYGAFY